MNVRTCNMGVHEIEECELIFVEPFYGGSHKQLIDTLQRCKI